jgi:hypothetical protein
LEILEGPRLENVDTFYGPLEYFADIWDILWPLETFCVNLVYSSGFGIVCQENSGNPGYIPTNWRNFLQTLGRSVSESGRSEVSWAPHEVPRYHGLSASRCLWISQMSRYVLLKSKYFFVRPRGSKKLRFTYFSQNLHWNELKSIFKCVFACSKWQETKR